MGIFFCVDWFEFVIVIDLFDIEVINREMEYFFGWFVYLIFVDGDYLKLFKLMLEKKNKIILKFIDYELMLIKG